MDIVTYALLKKYIKTSLEGAGALTGKSAYDLAVENGYSGTESDWLSSLKGEPGSIPYIGENGNWFVDGKDSNVPATPILDYNQLINKPTIDGEDFEGDLLNYIDAISIEELEEIIKGDN